jgi:hypothetical protein
MDIDCKRKIGAIYSRLVLKDQRMAHQLFKGRNLVIATMHGKEKVIAPLLEHALGVKIIVPENFDTDQYGTFSGEIEREVDPVEAARTKAKVACKNYKCDLGIASEGSFGSHPSLFFVPADNEIIVFVDIKNGIEVKAREVSTKTNFDGDLCRNWEEAKEFAQAVQFPSHALILRKEKEDVTHLLKGINTWVELEDRCLGYLKTFGQVFLETDMRAMNNPTRMGVIEIATKKLIDKIHHQCPQCGLPGFDVTEVVTGLPCSLCGLPTNSTLYYIYKCDRCRFEEKKMYPYGIEQEEPTYCNYCNP